MGDLNSVAEEVGTLDCIVFEGDKEPETLLNGDLNKDGAGFLGALGDSIFSLFITRIFVGLSLLTSGIW